MPCLYDKSDQGYKEIDKQVNARKAVEEEFGMEEGKKNIKLKFT